MSPQVKPVLSGEQDKRMHGQEKHPRNPPKVIWRLLTIGVLITWLGTASLMYFLLNFSPAMSLLLKSVHDNFYAGPTEAATISVVAIYRHTSIHALTLAAHTHLPLSEDVVSVP